MRVNAGFSSLVISVLLVSGAANVSANTDRMTLNFKGSAQAVPKQVPDALDVGTNLNGLLDANCFSADLLDLKTGERLGTAEDCLSEIAGGTDTTSGSGVQVVGTTVFNLPLGKLVIQGLTTAQPVNWPTQNNEVLFTHITGANSPDNAVLTGGGEFSSTGIYQNAVATVRLSGQVNLSMAAMGEITFDCVFVVDLETGSSTLAGQRYDTTQGEIFWDKGAYTEFNVYRDGALYATNDGSSLYEPGLIEGVSYTYIVKAKSGDAEIDLGQITLPGSAGNGI